MAWAAARVQFVDCNAGLVVGSALVAAVATAAVADDKVGGGLADDCRDCPLA